MDQYIKSVRQYNRTLAQYRCSPLEKQYIACLETHDYLTFCAASDVQVGHDVEAFLRENHDFCGLLPQGHGDLCLYLRHIHEFSCNHQTIRMGARSRDLGHYPYSVASAIGAFYVFHAAGLQLQDLIYGAYQSICHFSLAPVIAARLLQDDPDAMQWCRDVLLSENNTAVLTRDVIIAIEQSHNHELQSLLNSLFLNAKLQEGLRQAISETADEGQLDYFLQFIDIVAREDLLRFSSVRRAVMNWIAIGYDVPEERELRFLFARLSDFLHHPAKREAALSDQNPLCVYLALYCRGVSDLEAAVAEAVSLLSHPRHHIVCAALVYLHLCQHFDPLQYRCVLIDHGDDPWIAGFYFRSLCYVNLRRRTLSAQDIDWLYPLLLARVSHMKARETFTSQDFPWFRFELERDSLLMQMENLIRQRPLRSMIISFIPFLGSYYNSWSGRSTDFLDAYCKDLPDTVKKPFLIKEILSANEALSQWTMQELKAADLTEEDRMALEGRLKTKKGYARANILHVLAIQRPDAVRRSYDRLTASASQLIQESAQELRRLAPGCFPREDTAAPVRVIGKQGGYGLYTPCHVVNIPLSNFLTYRTHGFFRKKQTPDLAFLAPLTHKQMMDYFMLWDQRIDVMRGTEYEVRGDYYTIGTSKRLIPLSYRGQQTLDCLPFADMWRRYFERDNLSLEAIFQLQVYFVSDIYLTRCFPKDSGVFDRLSEDTKAFSAIDITRQLLQAYFVELQQQGLFRQLAAKYLEVFHRCVSFGSYLQVYHEKKLHYSLGGSQLYQFIVSALDVPHMDDAAFRRYFPLLYVGYARYQLRVEPEVIHRFRLQPLTVARAVTLDLLPDTVLYECLLDTHEPENRDGRFQPHDQLLDAYRQAYFRRRAYDGGQPDFSLPPEHPAAVRQLRQALQTVADTLLHMESGRINEASEITDTISQLRVICGMKYLIQSLHMLENETLTRETGGHDRVVEFCNVIRCCYPLPNDDAALLQKEGFPDTRLVEVAMMAPQWIDIVSQALGWDGFKDTCYYFIAHIRDYNSDCKKAEIAPYTALDPEDLNDGAFDINWCRRVTATLGEEHLQIMYRCAKFLCTNTFHTRIRKYTDACLGRKPKAQFLQQAREKRSKDDLNAYCICPLVDETDLLERYTAVQQFLRESRQFGAQRQASEKRTCEIALMNLAANSPYETATRLSWVMESRLATQYAYALQPQTIGDTQLQIVLDKDGQNHLVITKGGKQLKSLPANLRKEPTAVQLQEIHKLWKTQQQRSRAMLESAMAQRTVFTRQEIDIILENPIVAPLLGKLVLCSGDHFGYYSSGRLCGPQGEFAADSELRIAHPFDLYRAGVWQDFQQDIFRRQLRQPFKQVFRELYLKLDNEVDRSETRRYTGYQIQPKQASGALRSRGWNLSYENGLEKILYKEDLTVSLCADANWFSPADIEAPSIDYVAFTSRRSGQPVLIRDIDDITFSEVMRDVDLAVSVAYVGGVDPLTSFSTLELRQTILRYTCQLMQLANVTIDGHFAVIRGGFNTYRVHLGSGVVHQDGGSAIHIVPVYSGHRGKVYLPFLDEDPLTAQILSKTILLAEDGKIKDPEILRQIHRKA